MKLNPAEMFKVLGVESRIRIIELLKSRGPLGPKKIAEVLDITPAAVSQHLRVLRQAALVRNQRKGYWIPYSIDVEALENCGCTLMDVCSCGCKTVCTFKKQELDKASVRSLMKYEKELAKQLQKVREKITELKQQKR